MEMESDERIGFSGVLTVLRLAAAAGDAHHFFTWAEVPNLALDLPVVFPPFLPRTAAASGSVIFCLMLPELTLGFRLGISFILLMPSRKGLRQDSPTEAHLVPCQSQAMQHLAQRC